MKTEEYMHVRKIKEPKSEVIRSRGVTVADGIGGAGPSTISLDNMYLRIHKETIKLRVFHKSYYHRLPSG